jgi:hypothetical protein
MVNSEDDATSSITSRKEIMLQSFMPTALGHSGYDPMPRLLLCYLIPQEGSPLIGRDTNHFR